MHREAVGPGTRPPRENGASWDPFLGTRATWPDYQAYLRWCRSRGVVPQPSEPYAYGDAVESAPDLLAFLSE